MYVFPMPHDIYAVVPYRLWWAPWRWRWRLVVYWWRDVHLGFLDQTLAYNISKSEVIGLMKLLGYPYEIST